MSGTDWVVILLVLIVVGIGLLAYFIAIERRVTERITVQLAGANYHFACTCGWSGWRRYTTAPTSMKCPRCNGVAPQLNYRGREA